MISVIILDNHEPQVIRLTYENLWKELKDITDSELIVADNWLDPLPRIKNDYVCFVEADCLVSSGYFSSQVGLFKKNPFFRKLAMLSSAVGVNNFANRIYGYRINDTWSEPTHDDISIRTYMVEPNRNKASTGVYPIQVGYVPGSIIRISMLRDLLDHNDFSFDKSDNLVKKSIELSFKFWQQGDGNRVHINPNTTYVTTENYVNDIVPDVPNPGALKEKFEQEVI